MWVFLALLAAPYVYITKCAINRVREKKRWEAEGRNWED